MADGTSGFFEDLKASLEESIAFSRGELSLVTTVLPARPPIMTPAEIVDLRGMLRMSQAVFAAVINVSPKTVQSWEQGIRAPSQAALRMLEVIREDPSLARLILSRGQESARDPVNMGRLRYTSRTKEQG